MLYITAHKYFSFLPDSAGIFIRNYFIPLRAVQVPEGGLFFLQLTLAR